MRSKSPAVAASRIVAATELDGRQVHNALSGLTSTSRVNTVCRTQGLIVGMNWHSVRPDGKILTVGDGDSERPLIDHRRDWIRGDVVYDVDYQPISTPMISWRSRGRHRCSATSFHDVPSAPSRRYVSRSLTSPPTSGRRFASLSRLPPAIDRDLNDLWLEYPPDRLSPKARSLRQLLGRLQAG